MKLAGRSMFVILTNNKLHINDNHKFDQFSTCVEGCIVCKLTTSENQGEYGTSIVLSFIVHIALLVNIPV